MDENEAKREHVIKLQNICVRIEQEKHNKAAVIVQSRKKTSKETELVKTVAMKEGKRYAEKEGSKRQHDKE